MTSPHSAARRGRLFVIAAPSGAGKTSLVRALMEREPSLRFSISYTTRPQRPTESHGRDYFFVSKDEFAAMVGRGEFLEHARVFDNFYGTARSQVEASLAGRTWEHAEVMVTGTPTFLTDINDYLQGGMLTLGLSLAWVLSAQARGETASQFVPVTMAITAVVYALAAITTFVLLREPRP